MLEKDFLNLNKKDNAFVSHLSKGLILIPFTLVTLCLCWFFSFNIPDKMVGILIKNNKPIPTVYYPGRHLYNPFTEEVILLDSSPIIIEKNFMASTNNNKRISARIRISIKINPEEYQIIAKSFTGVSDFRDNVLLPAITEVISGEMHRHNSNDVINDPNYFKVNLIDPIKVKLNKLHTELLLLFVMDISVVT